MFSIGDRSRWKCSAGRARAGPARATSKTPRGERHSWHLSWREALFSTLGRVLARGIETRLLVEAMGDWLDELDANIAAGDLAIPALLSAALAELEGFGLAPLAPRARPAPPAPGAVSVTVNAERY